MLPSRLYRYRPIHDNTLWEIEHNAIYLQRLDGLNDPGEGMFDVDLGDIWVVRKHLVGIALQEGNTDYSERVLALPDGDLAEIIRQQGQAALKGREDWGVVCFTERHDNWHIWSHYANSCSGVVLEYDLSKASIPPAAFRKVRYEDRPSLTMSSIFNEEDEGGFFELLSYKSRKWASEEEWRLLAPIKRKSATDPKRLFQIPLARVITGIGANDRQEQGSERGDQKWLRSVRSILCGLA